MEALHTCEGGPQGATMADHSVTAGVAFVRPLDIKLRLFFYKGRCVSGRNITVLRCPLVCYR